MARSKPRLGQNFLVSPSAPRAIVEALGPLERANVVEIGPGRGAITGLLAARARRLIAIELDRSLASALQEQFAAQPSVRIVAEDILKVDLAQLARNAGDKLLVVGNLPYYITSDILLHLFAQHDAVARAVLMMQREVADRVTAVPGTRDYGVLSATAQMHATVERLLTLPPEAFSPPPEVHSTVVRLDMRPRFAELEVRAEQYSAIVRQAFAQKRKTLANNLKAAGYANAQIEAALGSCAIPAMARAETLPVETLACLARRLRPSAGVPNEV